MNGPRTKRRKKKTRRARPLDPSRCEYVDGRGQCTSAPTATRYCDRHITAAASAVAGDLRLGRMRLDLQANRERRQAAAREFAASRDELRALLGRGHGVMTITEMCALAGIRRERGHEILSGSGRPRFMENELDGGST